MFRQLHARSACALAGAGLLALLASAPASAAECDRACLGGLVTQYIDALVAHDLSGLPLAPGARFTENAQDIAPGPGAAASVTGKSDFRQDYLDTAKQVAASHFVLREGDNQLLYSVVLHVEDAQVAGVETLVQTITPESRFQPTMLGAPIPHMNDPVPAAERDTREEMIRTALTYTEGLRIGSFVTAQTMFDADATRVENGVVTSGVGCSRDDCDMQSQTIIEHPDVTASVAAVDEENSVVLLWMNFGDTNSYGEGNALVTFEAFKVRDGKIHAVNAFFPILPKDTQRNWPSADPLP